MIKVALIDWDDTIVNWHDDLRQQAILEILQNSPHVNKEILQRINTDFTALVAEARAFAKQQKINHKSVTVLFDYVWRALPEAERTLLLLAAKIAYRQVAAAKLQLFPAVIEQLQLLKDQGYQLAVISDKAKTDMDIEYKAVVKNYPQLAALIPENQVFATTNKAEEKPQDFLHRQALVGIHTLGKITLDGSPMEFLIMGNSPACDLEAAGNFHKCLFGGQDSFTYRDQTFPVPEPYASLMHLALFDPKKKHTSDLLVPFQAQGLETFQIDSWQMLNPLLAGEKRNKPEHVKPHSIDEIKTFAKNYVNGREPGYYILRSHPRCWVQLTKDNILIVGKEAAPANGCVEVTFVDVDDEAKQQATGRDRWFGPKKTFVHEGKVFNASAYITYKNNQGEDYILFIKDKRNWNTPIGRVDGDELTKAENQSFLSMVRGKGLANAYCILAALREAQEEAGISLKELIAEKGARILPYSSDDMNGNSLSDEVNYATTVTMQVVVDLGTLTPAEILKLRSSLAPQALEHIVKAEFVPVASIMKESASADYPRGSFSCQPPSTPGKQNVFKHTGRVITALRDQKQVPFDHIAQPAIAKINKDEPAPWYVMVSNQAIPIDATIYKPTNYHDENRNAVQLQKDLVLCQQMTGAEVFNFSPERLALHETILALSLYNLWSSEEEFENTTRRIYQEKVKPFIAANLDKFVLMTRKVEAEVTHKLRDNSTSSSSTPDATEQLIISVRKSFNSILASNRLRHEKLDTKIKDYNASKPGATRPTPAEREDHKRLAELINNAEKNELFIIQQRVTSQLVQQQTTQQLRTMLYEKQTDSSAPLLRDPELAKQYNLKPKTFHPNADRRSVLVAGGAASGKGSVTDLQLKAFQHDMLELNPDLYKKLLLPMSTDPAEIKMHGTLTHNESSMVFDSLIEYWSKLAASGSAPHTLIDVVRAGGWIRGKLSVGDTQIEVHLPVLATLEALKRSYARGVKTGRFVPTAMLIQGHKDQVSINVDAMRAGCNFTFYDTGVGLHEALPISSTFSAIDKQLIIYNIAVMTEYFQKGDLRPTANNEFNLSGHTPKSAIRYILNYVDHMAIHLYEGEKPIAHLQKNAAGLYVLQVMDWTLFQKQLGAGTEDFLQGLIENETVFQHESEQLGQLIAAIEERLRNPKPEAAPLQLQESLGFDAEKCLLTACRLVEEGADYVRNPHGLWVYTPPRSQEEFDKHFPHGKEFIKTTEEEKTKIHTFRPENQLTFDIREFPTKEDCERKVMSLREDGSIQSQHITTTSHVSANYGRNDTTPHLPDTIQWYTALPKKLRAFKVDNVEKVQVANQYGKPLFQRMGGWVKCSEEHMDALTLAVANFQAQPDNAAHEQALLQIALKNIYSSGPFNIEDGYDYYVSQTALRCVFDKLTRCSSFYINPQTSENFVGIKLEAPLNLTRDERAEAGNYIFLPVKDISSLAKTLAMMEANTIDLNNIPRLAVLTEDDVRRTYQSPASAMGKLGLLPAPTPAESSTRLAKETETRPAFN